MRSTRLMGPSLAVLYLLCAALAWQASEQAKCDEFNALLEQATASQSTELRDVLLGYQDVEFEEAPTPDIISTTNPDGGGGFIDPDQVDFMESAAYHLPRVEGVVKQRIPNLGYGTATGPEFLVMPKKKKCPKIYFGTRTHKQVEQIVRELKKTAYSDVRMSLLASREHTCVHPTVSKSYNKNQDCKDLMDKNKGGGCRFQSEVKRRLASHQSLRGYLGHNEAWDLEDLVKVGKKVKACLYYAVRELKTSAQIIFCPYNYLVDPGIRKAMEINLKNQVVVLDEAHNIEDVQTSRTQ